MSPRASSPRSAARLVSLLFLGVLAPAARAQELVQPRLAAPAPSVAIRPESPPGLEAYGCASCHAEVTAEWAASAHGLAWVDEQYQKDMRSKKRPELCHGCHAPEPLLAGLLGSKPDTRATVRELGVHCESCHADAAGVVLGPRGTQVAAHPSKVAPELVVPGSNALCSSCHATNVGPVIGIAKDFATAGFESRGLSCVGCHMAPLERSWASDAPARLGRSHALQTPRDPGFLRQAFALELRSDAKGSELVVRNQAGHRVPGLVGRKLVFEAELLDAAGAVLERGALSLDERAYLPVEGTRSIRFTRAGASARVKAVHHDPRATSPVPFLDETVRIR